MTTIWMIVCLLVHTVMGMAPTLPVVDEVGSPPSAPITKKVASSKASEAHGAQARTSNRQLKKIRKVAKREQKAAHEAAFPDQPPEWPTKCKEDYDATSLAKGVAPGSSIFSLNCTSLTEDILLYIRCVLKDTTCISRR